MHIHIYALCYIIHYIHVYVHTCMYILRFPPLPSPSPLPSPLYFSSERVFFVFTRVRHSISLAHSCTFVSSLFISRSFWDRCGFLIFFFFLFFFITNFSSSLFRSLFFFSFFANLTPFTFDTFTDSSFSFFLHRLSICILT